MGNNLPKIVNDVEIKNYLIPLRDSLAGYAIRKYSYGEFLNSAMLAITGSETLKNCLRTEKGRLSLKSALRFAAVNGLSLNPQLGKACIVAYGDVVSYQPMKDGLIDLAMESGKIEIIESDFIHKKDKFEVTKTTKGAEFRHTPAVADRGEIVAYYVCVILKTGRSIVKHWDKTRGLAHRDKYAKGLYDKNGKLKPGHSWVKSFDPMVIKSILKEIFRTTKISPELSAAVVTDDIAECRPGIKNITEEAESMTSEELKDKIKNHDPTLDKEQKTEVSKPKPGDAF